MFGEYLDYKRGFEDYYLAYFSNITESSGAPFLNEFVTRNLSGCTYHGSDCLLKIKLGIESCNAGHYECEYEIREKLQVVDIFFDTPTFDKITRDAKTNDVAKFSMIGGTLGLLTGE